MIWHARADGRVRRNGVGGGSVGINPEVDVPQGAELRLEHDLFAVLRGVIEIQPRIADIRQEFFSVFFEIIHHVLHGYGLRAVHARDREIFPFHDIFQAFPQQILMEKFAHADGFFQIFVAVDRRDAALCGTVFLIFEPLLFQTVLHHVIRHADDRRRTYFQIFGSNGDTRRLQPADLAVKVLDIDDHAVAHDVDNAVAQNAARQQVQNKFSLFVDDRMPRVVTALIAHDHVVFRRKQIDHTAFALVAPVDTANRRQHISLFSFSLFANAYILTGMKTFVKAGTFRFIYTPRRTGRPAAPPRRAFAAFRPQGVRRRSAYRTFHARFSARHIKYTCRRARL